MVRGVKVFGQRKNGYRVDIKGSDRCSDIKKGWFRFNSSTYFATRLPSFDFCARERYNNNTMVRGMRVLWQRKNGYKVDIMGCGRCSVMKK